MSHKPLAYFTVISLVAHAAAIGILLPAPPSTPSTADTAIEIGMVSLPHVSTDFSRDMATAQRPQDRNSQYSSVTPGSALDPAKSVQPTTQTPTQKNNNSLTESESPSQTESNASAAPMVISRSTLSQTAPVSATKAAPLSSANQPPTYPAAALRYGWEGEVRLKVIITRSGVVSDVVIEQSSNYSILDQAAIDTVRNWKFEPARVGHETTEGSVQVPIRFKIKRS